LGPMPKKEDGGVGESVEKEGDGMKIGEKKSGGELR
jgi:hypothetical protein